MIDPALVEKYGAHAVENGQRLQPKSFARKLALRDSVDQHFTKAWLEFVIEGFGDRTVLDGPYPFSRSRRPVHHGAQ